MSALSNQYENKILDHILNNTALAQGTVYVGLFTGSASSNLENSILTNEVSGNGYSRQTAAFGAASGGSASNSGKITWTATGGAFGTITTVALINLPGTTDSAGEGDVIAYATLAASKDIQDGDSFQISTGNLTLTLA